MLNTRLQQPLFSMKEHIAHFNQVNFIKESHMVEDLAKGQELEQIILAKISLTLDQLSTMLSINSNMELFRGYLSDRFGSLDELIAFCDLPSSISMTKVQKEIILKNGMLRHLFWLYYADTASAYYHRLAAFLDESTQACLVIEKDSSIHAAEFADITSCERFCHIKLMISDHHESRSANLAIVLPHDCFLNSNVFQTLNQLIEELSINFIPYKTIPETNLTESWQELEAIVFINDAFSMESKRIAHGFQAAEGIVVSYPEKWLDADCDLKEYMVKRKSG